MRLAQGHDPVRVRVRAAKSAGPGRFAERRCQAGALRAEPRRRGELGERSRLCVL